MYYVYVIASITHGTRYVGSTEDVASRLYEHNDGRCRYTSGRRPWRLAYQEKYTTRAEAMRREKYLKSGIGRELLDKILSTPAGSSNGRMPLSESGHLGSNPSPAGVARGNGSAPSTPPAYPAYPAHQPQAENPSPAAKVLN